MKHLSNWSVYESNDSSSFMDIVHAEVKNNGWAVDSIEAKKHYYYKILMAIFKSRWADIIELINLIGDEFSIQAVDDLSIEYGIGKFNMIATLMTKYLNRRGVEGYDDYVSGIREVFKYLIDHEYLTAVELYNTVRTNVGKMYAVNDTDMKEYTDSVMREFFPHNADMIVSLGNRFDIF